MTTSYSVVVSSPEVNRGTPKPQAGRKPITLLSGSNLLHLLEKHGHHAKIDLRDAKRILAEKDTSC
jgi:hypothetical protein